MDAVKKVIYVQHKSILSCDSLILRKDISWSQLVKAAKAKNNKRNISSFDLTQKPKKKTRRCSLSDL